MRVHVCVCVRVMCVCVWPSALAWEPLDGIAEARPKQSFRVNVGLDGDMATDVLQILENNAHPWHRSAFHTHTQ